MSYYGFRPYVPVAKRRAQAAKQAAQFAKAGRALSPVIIEGRTIAKTFWGKSWCQHLESFSDYENRLPRGRTYARNGSVLDLQIAKGVISALVMGSDLYQIRFTIAPLHDARWAGIKLRSTGQIDSLVELLQGRFSDAVMRVITDRDTGLFPAPSEIKKSCSCPDSASLCKHLAAVLYGIGARLDEQPELLFLLRGVDHLELLEGAPAGTSLSGPSALDSADLANVFGIEIAEMKTAEQKPAKNADSLSAAPAKKRQAATTATKTKPASKKPQKRFKPSVRKSPGRSAQPTPTSKPQPALKKKTLAKKPAKK